MYLGAVVSQIHWKKFETINFTPGAFMHERNKNVILNSFQMNAFFMREKELNSAYFFICDVLILARKNFRVKFRAFVCVIFIKNYLIFILHFEKLLVVV